MEIKKVLLSEDEMPRQWYNILADIKMNPPLGPDGNPVSPDQLAPVFPMNLIEQEVSYQRWIDIPDEVLSVYRIWRPSPLVRAYALEKALDTPARIYYKNEGVSPPGSHKPNTAVPQAYYNKVFGIKRLTTETGAGQWGSALAFACSQFGLACKVFHGPRQLRSETLPQIDDDRLGSGMRRQSEHRHQGRPGYSRERPGHTGKPWELRSAKRSKRPSAIPPARPGIPWGAFLNHVMLHQTIIGLEAKKQLEKIGEYPNIIIGCAGGGSNFAGIAYPFVYDKINGKDVAIYPVEPAACPTLTRAPFAYDHGDTAGYTPLLPMHSLGHTFVPAPIHAGGLRYHGMAPTVSQLVDEGLLEPKAVEQLAAFEAGVLFARTEGIISAPETNHALACRGR